MAFKFDMDNKTLIDTLSKKLNIPQTTTTKLIEGLASSLGECGTQLDSIVIAGFGTFEPRKRMERVALHPASGKRLLIPPKILIYLNTSYKIKQPLKKSE